VTRSWIIWCNRFSEVSIHTHWIFYNYILNVVLNQELNISGGSNWDGQYFMHIAINGYTEESTVAFFPLFPMLLYVIARPIYTLLWWCLSLSSIVLVVGWCLNAILFMKTAQALYKIAERYQTQYGHTLTSTAVIIFCFNPASVFFSALYTESLFSFLTTSVVLSLIER